MTQQCADPFGQRRSRSGFRRSYCLGGVEKHGDRIGLTSADPRVGYKHHEAGVTGEETRPREGMEAKISNAHEVISSSI